MRSAAAADGYARRLSGVVAKALCANVDDLSRVFEIRDPRLGRPFFARHLLRVTNYHGVTPLLWEALRETPNLELREPVDAEYRALVARGLRLDVATLAAADAFDQAGVEYAVFKGRGVAQYYPRPGLRFSSDVDLLVDRDDVLGADAAIRRAGGVSVGMSCRDALAVGFGEANYTIGRYGNIDLHWHVMPQPRVRRAFNLSTKELLSRTMQIVVGGGRRGVPALDAADMLIAVATHACFSGADRLGWLADIKVLTEHRELDWSAVAQRVSEAGVALPVQVMVDRTDRAIGVAVREPLASGIWRRAVADSSALWPAYRGSDRIVRGAFVYKATRRTSAASVKALLTDFPWDAVIRVKSRRAQIRASRMN